MLEGEGWVGCLGWGAWGGVGDCGEGRRQKLVLSHRNEEDSARVAVVGVEVGLENLVPALAHGELG